MTGSTNRVKLDLDLDKAYQFIEKFKERTPKEKLGCIIFHGAEAMLVPVGELKAFQDKSAALFETSVKGVLTNLVHLFSKEQIDFLVSQDRVFTSWDMDSRFKTEGQFKLWSDNVKLVSEKGGDVTVIISLMKDMVLTYPAKKIIEMAIKIGAKGIKFNRLHINTDEHLLATEDEIIAYFKDMIDDTLEHKYYKSIHNYSLDYLNLQPGFCSIRRFTINPDETVCGCSNTYLDPYGTIDEYIETPEVFNKKKYKELVKQHEWRKSLDLEEWFIYSCYQAHCDGAGVPLKIREHLNYRGALELLGIKRTAPKYL